MGGLTGEFAKDLDLGAAGELAGLLHDLGKSSKEFQAYIRSALGLKNPDEDDYVDAGALRGRVDHSTAGAQWVWNTLGAGHTFNSKERIAAEAIAVCIASHHSGLIDTLGTEGGSTRFGADLLAARLTKPEDRVHGAEAAATIDPSVLEKARELVRDPCLVEGIWRALQKAAPAAGNGPLAAQFQFGLVLRFLFSCLIDADRIDTADFEYPSRGETRQRGRYTPWTILIERLEAELERRSNQEPINIIRASIADACRDAADRPAGIYTLTVPTGGGKTLASLRFALHHAQRLSLERIVYVVPFTSIIDQNAADVRQFLERPDAPEEFRRVVLEHHASLTPEQQSWREKVLTEDWDAPVVFTTMVQFLEAFFGGGTRGARRLHQLAKAVVIFDEPQALPIKCVHLFNQAINFLAHVANSTVVLCTATQPLFHRVDREKGAARLASRAELGPEPAALFRRLERVTVVDRRKAGGWRDNEVAELAVREMNAAGSSLVIANTKRSAREVFKLIEPMVAKGVVYHLSADMCPAHRRVVLGRKGDESSETIVGRLETRRQVICVSTPVIEAGIDVDFGSVVRFSAGLDSIAQAAGRCNRHGRRTMGMVYVVNPANEALGSLDDIKEGRAHAERVLADIGGDPARYPEGVLGPGAMEDYYAYYFFGQRAKMDYPVEVGYDTSLLDLLSSNSIASREHEKCAGAAPPLFWRQAFMTAGRAFKAIEAPTGAVIVAFGKEGQRLVDDLRAAAGRPYYWELVRAAQQFSVSVYPHTLTQLKQRRALSPVSDTNETLVLERAFYSDRFGLSVSRVSPEELFYV